MKPRNPHQVGLHVHFDHIWDDPLNNYHPAQTLGNPKGFMIFMVVFLAFQMAGCQSSELSFFLGVSTVEPLVFLLRKPGEPWGTPCEISNMSFGNAGWQGASPKTPRTWCSPWSHDGLQLWCEKKRDCECLWMLWPVTHMAIYGPENSCDQKRVFKEEKVPPPFKLAQLLRMRSASFPMAAWKPSL